MDHGGRWRARRRRSDARLRDARDVRRRPPAPARGGLPRRVGGPLRAEDDAAQGRSDVPGAWHQDGAFMGDVRALNLWLSLSRCGDESPGLDIVPRRLDQMVATTTDEALLTTRSPRRRRRKPPVTRRSSGRSSSPATRSSSTRCSCTRPDPIRRCRSLVTRSRAGSSAARHFPASTRRSRSRRPRGARSLRAPRRAEPPRSQAVAVNGRRPNRRSISRSANTCSGAMSPATPWSGSWPGWPWPSPARPPRSGRGAADRRAQVLHSIAHQGGHLLGHQPGVPRREVGEREPVHPAAGTSVSPA